MNKTGNLIVEWALIKDMNLVQGSQNESMSIATGPQQTKAMEFGPFRP